VGDSHLHVSALKYHWHRFGIEMPKHRQLSISRFGIEMPKHRRDL